MSAYVAEYFGQRTDAPGNIIPIEIPRNSNGKVRGQACPTFPSAHFLEVILAKN